MAVRRSVAAVRNRQLLLEPTIRKAFIAMVRDLVGAARASEVARHVEAGSVEGVMRELGLNAASMTEVLEGVRASYVSGGDFSGEMIRSARGAKAAAATHFRFDVRNDRAEQWLRTASSRLVTNVVTEQRAAIRTVVTAGMQAGANPRTTALNIIGRVDPATGRRVGGIVGLSSNQAEFVANARRQLASGDPQQMREYLTRRARDRRLDGIVNRAIAEGRAVRPSDIDKIVDRYSDRLLQLRGETIARTESLAAFNEARDEAFAQLIEEGKVDAQAVTKVWISAGDERTRDAHDEMHEQTVPFAQPFKSPTGAYLMHPGDTSLGAGPEDIINCRCVSENRVDFLRGIK
jgi:uncharacterized protein with gpF-like domain